MAKFTVGQLLADLKMADPEEEIVVVFSLGDDSDDGDVTEIADGDILDVMEAGGYSRGMRMIVVEPRPE